MKKYIPSQIEPKWQKKWEENKLNMVDLDRPGNKYYVLAEFAYPSGDLHMGHWFTWGGADIFARLKRMQGYNVFFPNGFDAFGLPAENAAMKRKIHPQEWTLSNIESMRKQYQTMGGSFEFDHGVVTCLPEYYKWNQWIFLKMLGKGVAYKGRSYTNWCPKDQTVLADEQVVGGVCERCGTEVTKKEIEQWFLKITSYADRLLWDEGGNGIDWPKAVMEGQNDWIGKSEGINITYSVIASEQRERGNLDSELVKITTSSSTSRNDDITITCFTIRPDTNFGTTFIVLAPEHPLVLELVDSEHKTQVQEYIAKAGKKSELERKENKEKTGVFTGSYVKNPINDDKVPVWVADYVLAGYGTGAVMGVPAHDQRDFEFAKQFNLPIKEVVKGGDLSKAAYAGEGEMMNSGKYNGMLSSEAREKISDYLEQHHLGKRKTNYHLHDWSISRQRYWGTPIPIIYCDKCGTVPVPEKDLPVELPKTSLVTNDSWLNVKCPKCQGEGRRDTDTMDGFFDNSWYFFRYLDNKNEKQIFRKERAVDWLSLEIYFGGAEHTLGHTLYSRFFTKFFYDLGLITFEEYAKKRVNHGIVLGSDGEKMSKSRGNVVNPDDQVKEYGADAIRVHMAFFMPYEGTSGPWISERVGGAYRFLQRIWGLQEKVTIGYPVSSTRSMQNINIDSGSKAGMTIEDQRIMHKTIKKVTEDIEAIKFNTAIASLMEWLNYLSRKDKISGEEYKTLLLLLSPFAPHIAEELWQSVVPGNTSTSFSATPELKNDSGQAGMTDGWSIHQQSWPKSDNQYLEEDEIPVAVQVNGKVRAILVIQKDIISDKEVVEMMALENEKVQKFLEGKSVKKVVYIPGKVINIVTDS